MIQIVRHRNYTLLATSNSTLLWLAQVWLDRSSPLPVTTMTDAALWIDVVMWQIVVA